VGSATHPWRASLNLCQDSRRQKRSPFRCIICMLTRRNPSVYGPANCHIPGALATRPLPRNLGQLPVRKARPFFTVKESSALSIIRVLSEDAAATGKLVDADAKGITLPGTPSLLGAVQGAGRAQGSLRPTRKMDFPFLSLTSKPRSASPAAQLRVGSDVRSSEGRGYAQNHD
jgi:hypothetical protein